MSTYATLAELKDYLGSTTLYPQLTDRVTGASADDVVGQNALDGAEALMNSYLGVVYDVPVAVTDSQVAKLLKNCALDLAEYELWQAGGTKRNETPQRVTDSYDNWIDFLQRIAAGKAVLPSAAALDPSDTAPAATFGSHTRVFTERTMDRF